MSQVAAIRPFHPSDLPTLYRICLLTGDEGRDASALHVDPELLGHYWAAPYAIAFYERLGFGRIAEDAGAFVFGRRLA